MKVQFLRGKSLFQGVAIGLSGTVFARFDDFPSEEELEAQDADAEAVAQALSAYIATYTKEEALQIIRNALMGCQLASDRDIRPESMLQHVIRPPKTSEVLAPSAETGL